MIINGSGSSVGNKPAYNSGVIVFKYGDCAGKTLTAERLILYFNISKKSSLLFGVYKIS